MTGWQEVSLEEVANDLTVGFVGSMASEYVPSGIPFLRSLNIEPLRVNKNDLKFITPEFHKRISKSKLTTGDVVIVRTGKPGACTVIPDWLSDANCSDLVIVRCGKRINNRFLAYYVNTAASGHVSAHLVGAVQQHFNVGSARTLKMNLPPITEQKAMVGVLGALDDKIELNSRMNATLEAAARAIFKSWFVDFSPVRAKMEGKPPFGMDAATASLFPARLNESEIGDIPENWTAPKFSSLFEVIGGGTPKTGNSEYWNGDIPWFSIADAPPHSDVFVLKTEKTITQKGLDESSTKIMQPGVTIITARGTVGRLALVGQPMAMNQSCYGLAPLNGITPVFLYFSTRKAIAELQSRVHGSVFDTITRDTFDGLNAIRPSEAVVSAFESVVWPMLEKIRSNLIEKHGLAKLRDYLLPKLISGEIRIPDAEKFVEGLV